MSEEEKKDDKKESEDLSNLLDSALGSFSAPQRTTDDELDDLMAVADARAAQNAARDFQTMLQQMITVQEDAMKKMEEEPAVEGRDEAERNMMLEAMKELMACSGAVAEAESPEEVLRRLEQIGSPDSNMEPLMNMMIETFISKDVLYPPLKEMHSAFPGYLESKKETLDTNTFSRYSKQYELIGKICEAFEEDITPAIGQIAEGEGPSGEDAAPGGGDAAPTEVGHIRIQKIGPLLVELQSCGYPPSELTGNLPDGWAMDSATGMPRVDDPTTAAGACSLM